MMYDMDLGEVLRYLGYKNNMEQDGIADRIKRIAEECKKELFPLYTYAVFDIEKADAVKVLGTNIVLCGEDIKRHLSASEKCAVLASTLGGIAEQRLMLLQKKSMTDAVIYDACCDSLIETVTDRAETEIGKLAEKDGYRITPRYSPGYGDLSLSIQANIISSLSADKRIGLAVTDENILIPRKSVTAVIGLERRSV